VHIRLNGITCLRATSRNCAAHRASPAATCDSAVRQTIPLWRAPDVRSSRTRRPRHFPPTPASGVLPRRS